MMSRLYCLIFALLSFGCDKDAEFLDYQKLPDQRQSKKTYPVNEVIQNNRIDILWVVDNSGSMYDIQQNIVKNAALFMQEFTKIEYLDWKMGLISTDKSERPYLGFEDLFDSKTPDPVPLFQRAVDSLGTRGDGWEYVFHNVDRVLNAYPDFQRAKSHFAVIMVSDEKEQSEERMGPKYEAMAFLNSVKGRLNLDQTLRFYGALKQKDLSNCENTYDDGNYAGSPYEKVVVETGGFTISACEDDFGTKLADIGRDIVNLLDSIKLLLKERPVVESIKVLYKGEDLRPGPRDEGGIWYYDNYFNTINFYNMKFITDVENDTIDIQFDIDDGWDRD